MTRVLETDETGALTIPAELLGDASPHSRYKAIKQNGTVILRPENAERSTAMKPCKRKTLTPEEWEEERKALADELGKVWPVGLSAADVISEMRR